ncbi:ZIP family metal transporter [Candidatus Pacebacteria bacterium]|nr:ZIP family metal transporter [Candidatus Paceibacterota bacterium]
MFTAFITASLIALSAVIGALFFGNHRGLVGVERFVIPVAVGILLAFIFNELLPVTLVAAPIYGSWVIVLGFVGFYVLANYLHQRFHALAAEDCDRKTAASLLLIGDAVHNLADGVILGTAFLVNPAVGIATALAIALHEIPQEIAEFGVLIRAGYNRLQAIGRNLLSASTLVVGTIGTMLFADAFDEYLWIITGLAAGNLLFVAASELLPRIHGNLKNYDNIWKAACAILLGFVLMSVITTWAHEQVPHEHHETPHSAIEDHHEHEHDDDEHHHETEPH